MNDRDGRPVHSRVPVPGSVALGVQWSFGVQWSPSRPRRRRISPKLFLPGSRRNGGLRRRRRPSLQHPPVAAYLTT